MYRICSIIYTTAAEGPLEREREKECVSIGPKEGIIYRDVSSVGVRVVWGIGTYTLDRVPPIIIILGGACHTGSLVRARSVDNNN